MPTPDLEHLILLTAVHGKDDPRAMTVAITWLSRYASLVAEHRLCKLISESAIPRNQTCGLGFMLNVALEHARLHDRRRNLERAMDLCEPADKPRPYFTIDCVNEAMRRRAKRRASEVSKRWNLWVEPLELKYDALRPAAWVIAKNPDLAFRADCRGDLRATILIALTEDRSAPSVSELSRRCGVSRTAVVNALQDLQLANRVICERKGRSCRIKLAA